LSGKEEDICEMCGRKYMKNEEEAGSRRNRRRYMKNEEEDGSSRSGEAESWTEVQQVGWTKEEVKTCLIKKLHPFECK
jgi:hypothetical protein